MTAQTTEWYPPEIKPVRVGYYQILREKLKPAHGEMPYWDGERWQFYKGSSWFREQTQYWRGLAADPEVTE